MRVTSLKLANLRAIEAAEFHFRADFNLVVGVNGVGKTTVLDALAVCLSAAVGRANRLRRYAVRFDIADMRMVADALDVECVIESGEENARYGYMLHTPRESSVPREEKVGMPREQMHDTPEKEEFVGELPPAVTGDEPSGRPLAILFSISRAIPSARALAKGAAAGGTDAAFWGALSNRRALCLGEFEAWMRVQEALSSERPALKRVLTAFEEAVARFLPDYKNLRLGGESASGSFLLIDRGTSTLPVRLLSDGERGVLAMVLDLTRRLAQANPAMEDPASEAEAVVLIDEIELHLHPKWQRQIVHKLTKTFPRCQFIATTHSPQVVASVEPHQVHLLTPAGIIRPDRSLGMDSNWILRHLMEADDRPEDAKAAIQSVESLIEKGTFKKARAAISKAKKNGLDLPEWSVLEARIARLKILAK